MSITELIVIVVGAGLGYWVVRKSLDAEPKNTRRAPQPTLARREESKVAAELPQEKAAEESWFQILGVEETASKEQITAAYKLKISQYHPDKVQTLGPELKQLAELKSRQINMAYDFALSRNKT